jgi:hypothetical protein
MVQVKAFAMLVIVAFTVDMAAYDGHYRKVVGHEMRVIAYNVGSLNWRGFV